MMMTNKFIVILIYSLMTYVLTNENIRFIDNNIDSTESINIINNTINIFQCQSDLDCNSNGICNTNNICVCNDGYSGDKCDQVLKSQLKAFLFEMIIGFGAGHWYTQRYLFASFKFVSFLFALYLIIFYPKLMSKYLQRDNSNCCSTFLVTGLYCLISCGILFWYIFDIIQFGLNNYSDGSGKPLMKYF